MSNEMEISSPLFPELSFEGDAKNDPQLNQCN